MRASNLPWVLLLTAACAAEDPVDAGPTDGGDAGPVDRGVRDAEPADTAADDVGPTDGAVSDAGVDAGVLDGGSAFGFSLRVPRTHAIPCMGPGCPSATVDAEDVDYVCDLQYGALDHYVYVQAEPMSYVFFMGYNYQVVAAFLSDGVTASPIAAVYNWGGNHHNDTITADVPGYQVRYDHSSFGFGFRQCQPMDCLVVYERGPGNEVANGCTRDRTVPAICKRVLPDGTLDPFVDTFMRCPGDD